MEERHRQALQLNRVRLVKSMQVSELWDQLLEKGIFSDDMIEEIKLAGTRRDQARMLLVELETRGGQAFPLFLQCLKSTGQDELADLLRGQGGGSLYETPPITPIPLSPSKKDFAEKPQVTREAWEKEQNYPMNSDPCGFCLIVNNVEFDEGSGLSKRTGSNVDRDKLEKTLGSFRFEVLVRNNLKGSEIQEELQRLAERDHSKKDCCLVVILSHGCETRHRQFPGGVYGTDGIRVPVERIVSYFNGNNCPGLRGKPKLFFIQACGGDQKDRGFEVDSESLPSSNSQQSLHSDATPVRPEAGDTDETDAVASLPTASDILVSYSTFPGFVSWRDQNRGSWYVETLDMILGEFASKFDLQTLLVMVANEVASKGTYKQIPGYFNFLRKRFFFRTV
ncbi:caspase-9 [Spea bombifrons]|uniref:caspase-9 n=1 Tax=Spea bombifrons TaxID=233779 RepID=UPI0023496B4D|nr:caspase-9 [Spea bombifrons]